MFLGEGTFHESFWFEANECQLELNEPISSFSLSGFGEAVLMGWFVDKKKSK